MALGSFKSCFLPFSLADFHFHEGWEESSGQSRITEPRADIKTCFLQLVGELVNIFNITAGSLDKIEN